MKKKWAVLCSTAIAAIYAAGYMATETQATERNAMHPASINTQSDLTNKLYQDGTFTGTGRNRRGSIEVAVTTKDDKITDVEISGFAMHYSEKDVVGLPDEVLRMQSAQVDNVSGATYSTQAFEDAVQDALSKAQFSS